MNIIDQFEHHMEAGRFADALPLIEDILNRNRSFPTSWYNYGVCLEALNRYDEAATAFRSGYDLDRSNKAFQFRVFRAFALKRDVDGFASFAEAEVAEDPEVLEALEEQEEFADIVCEQGYRRRMERFRK
jgi:tetratricopeptide (TPR) repeat protein